MRQKLKTEWIQLLVLLTPFCAIVLLWDKLPYWVPTHWNASGQVDGYSRKAFGTLLLPVVNLGMALSMFLLPLIDPKLLKLDAEIRASLWRTVRIIRLGISAFLSVVSLAMLAAALGWFQEGRRFNTLIYGGLSLLLILMGNFITKLRPNYFVGIRTPWTLESKEVWTRTHRAGGRMMMISGLLMLLLCFVVPSEKYICWVLIPITSGLTVFTFLYSFFVYKKQASKPEASA